MLFKTDKCPKCGTIKKLMFSNNPISQPVCFDCIKKELNGNNLEHADLFCRTYNIEFDPEQWMALASSAGQEVFESYASMFFDANQDNLYYKPTTKDVWQFVNKQWEKARTQTEILNRLGSIKESYIQRAMLKWGQNYSFEELVKLDNLFTSQIKANNIINPLQKEAVRSLCKIQIEIDKAIAIGDTKGLKDFSSAYGVFAKQAQLEDLVAETKTSDITTVAELYDYMEKQGFEFDYYNGADKDEVDRAIHDIQEANRRFVLESTGMGATLEDMIKKRQMRDEMDKTVEAAAETSIEDLMNFHAQDMIDVEEEDDEEITKMDFRKDDA